MLLESLLYLASLPLLGHALDTRQDDGDSPKDPFRRRASQSCMLPGELPLSSIPNNVQN